MIHQIIDSLAGLIGLPLTVLALMFVMFLALVLVGYLLGLFDSPLRSDKDK